MKLSELMTNYTPNADYEGWVTNDDYVFAINLTPETANTAVTDFAVVEMGIAGLDAQLNPITQDKTYIRAGQNTMKTGTQRSFSVTGDRYVGDEAQDYCLAHATKYGTGNKVVTDYVYFKIADKMYRAKVLLKYYDSRWMYATINVGKQFAGSVPIVSMVYLSGTATINAINISAEQVKDDGNVTIWAYGSGFVSAHLLYAMIDCRSD